MSAYEKLVTTIYSEEDIGRGIATSAAGITGLILYLQSGDVTIAFFSAVIVFPVIRIVAKGIHSAIFNARVRKTTKSRLDDQFDRLSAEEKQVLEFFVRAGGACVSWGMVNNSSLPFPRPAVNSLIQRGVLGTSVMEDGMTESFVLDVEYYDLAQERISIEVDV